MLKTRKIVELIINYLFIVIFSLLIYLRNVSNINIPIISITILILIYMIITSKPLGAIMAFLIPFKSAIQGNYIVLICIILYLFKERKKLTIKKNIILLIFILFIELINCFNEYSNIVEYITFSSTFLLLYFIVSTNYSNYEKIMILKNSVNGLLISMIIYLIEVFKNISLSDFFSGKFRLGSSTLVNGLEKFGLGFNANEIAMFALFGFTILIYLYKYKQLNKYIFYPSLMFITAIGLLSVSRAFLIGISLYVLIYIIFNIKNVAKLLIYSFTIIAVLLVMIRFNNSFFEGIINNYSNRFKNSDVTGNRTQIISDYNRIITSTPKNILIGSGVQNYNEKNNYYLSSHNATQEAFIAWGIVGGIVFILLIVSYLKNSNEKKTKKDIVSYLPLIIFIYMIQTIPFIAQGILLLLLYIIILPYKIEEKEGVILNEE